MITDLKINEEQRKKYYEKGYWTEDTIRDVWDRQAAAHRDDEYVADDQGARYTYGEIDDAASRLAAWLVDQGIESGDVVTLQFPNWAEFCIAYVACFKAGAVIQSLARNFNGADLTYAMNLVGSKAYIGPTYFHGVNYEEQILSIADDIPTLKAIALVDKKAPKAEGSTLPTVSEIVASTDPLTSYPSVKSDEVACLLSTSGTTGKPKEVMLTHNNILFSEGVFVKGLERTEDDVMWMPAPLNHAVGFFHGLLSPMLLGGRSVLMQDFDVESAIKLINAENATWSMCSTPFIYDILKYLDAHPDESIPTYVLHSCGGAPVPGALIDRAHRHNILLCEIFGSTESCPHIYVPPSKCVEWNGDWSGVPFEGIEVRYVDEQGNDVAPGVQGEHISRGPHQFVGYLNEPERTDRALNDDGWWFSGDLGYMDEEGRIRINGRRKEIIIRGGENLSAREIDDNLVGCPGVGESATIGMPDVRLGERICTFVAPLGDTIPTLESVTGYLAEKGIPKRLWPERIEIIEEIPKTLMGKVRRNVLTDELASRMAAEAS
ncbi:medium-chain fatty-acid--CoA ligase [uncultured Adlercreutzia sp.]|uniref:medium-chain fatty-acid--CoA ligase n=1 Tax=uncultured Adlercreutzia sp. TaxID=875803 RepID=UPI0025D415D1|nr:medium-chain fatty-acid--CoA ligase [uncultured Adlercreutzia sp.]MCI9262851.1 medium-chain fatty-acid--CoA ligase [Eggerthellaceae bacterium]